MPGSLTTFRPARRPPFGQLRCDAASQADLGRAAALAEAWPAQRQPQRNVILSRALAASLAAGFGAGGRAGSPPPGVALFAVPPPAARSATRLALRPLADDASKTAVLPTGPRGREALLALARRR